MKLRILVIAAVLAVCVQGAGFARDIVEEGNALLERASTLYKDARYNEAIALLLENKELFTQAGDQYYAKSVNLLGYLYQAMRDYTKAEPYFLEAKTVFERAFGKNNSDYVSSLNNLGVLYQNMRDYTKAEPYFLEIKTIYEQTLGKNNRYYAAAINNLGFLYHNMGDFAKAEPYYLEAKAVREQVLGKNHPDYAFSLDNLGSLYQNMKDYARAEPYLLEVKTIWEQTLGKNHSYYATSLNNLGSLYQAMEDYAKAETYYLEAKDIRERVLGKNNSYYAKSLNDLGGLYMYLEDYAKAEPYLLEVKTICEQTLGKNHPDYITSLNNLCDLYMYMRDYDKAEPYHLEVKTIWEQSLGKNNRDYAISLNKLGSLYLVMRNYSKAEFYYQEAKTVWEQVSGKNHRNYAGALNNLGHLYNAMGDYVKAEQNYLEAKNIREQVLGKSHPDYATSLNDLGSLYTFMMEDYTKAESYLLEAKTIDEQTLEKNNHDYAALRNYTLLLNNLGNLYRIMGDYSRAELYFLEAKTIDEQTLGINNRDHATLLNNLAILYMVMENYSKAEFYHQESNTILEKILGKNHPDYAGSINNLGTLYREMGDYAKAELYILEAKAILQQALGINHPNYAILLINLGSLYRNMGDYAKAELNYLEAKTILGRNYLYYSKLLGNISGLYQSVEDYEKAESYNKELCGLRIDLINQNFSFMSEQQRGAYLEMVTQDFESSYSLSLKYPVETVNGLNYTNTLFIKGLLLRTTNAVRDAIYSSGDAALIGQFEQLGSLHRQISVLQQKEDADKAYLQSLEEQADALDKALTRASSEYRNLKEDIAMQWQEVRDNLQPNEAAVEFVSFQVYDKKWTDTVQYAALVLRRGMDAPAWVPLCDEETLQMILGRANGRSSSQQAKILYEAVNGLELFNTVWEPLEKELIGVTTIYYSPSGLLHKIALNALPIDDSFKKRLTDKYNLNLVSSTREVVHLSRSKTETTQITSAVLYGGLDYDAKEKAMRTAAQSYQKTAKKPGGASVPPQEATRGSGQNTLQPEKALEKSLPEVVKIQGYLKKKKTPTTLYKGSLGNEESFKQLAGKKTGLIHLATHGFFLADVERKYDEQEQQQRGKALKAAENPLLRSGLLLAGANNTLANKPVKDVEDGILTADEIAGMNLLGTKLVVMSACQTGLGDVNNSEGVFGLQRAFKLAGVETLIMSLWKVSDVSTAKLMSVFYQEWLISGKSRQEAFKEAQRQVRAEYPLPFDWAAFVMMD